MSIQAPLSPRSLSYSAAAEQKEASVSLIQEASSNAFATAAHSFFFTDGLAAAEGNAISLESSILSLKDRITKQFHIEDKRHRENIKIALPLTNIPPNVLRVIRMGASLFNFSLGIFFRSPQISTPAIATEPDVKKRLQEELAQKLASMQELIYNAIKDIDSLILLKQNTKKHPDTTKLVKKRTVWEAKLQQAKEDSQTYLFPTLIQLQPIYSRFNRYQIAIELAKKFFFGGEESGTIDYGLAKKFLEIASKESQFNLADAFHLAWLLHTEPTTLPNIPLAIHYYKIAFDNSSLFKEVAAYRLAELLIQEPPHERNEEKIKQLYQIAAGVPNPNQFCAIFALAKLFHKESSFEKAIPLYLQVIESRIEHYDFAHIKLGEIFEIKDSLGNYKDWDKAEFHYHQAIAGCGASADDAAFFLANLYDKKCFEIASQPQTQEELDSWFQKAESYYKMVIGKKIPLANKAKFYLMTLCDSLRKPLDRYQEYGDELIARSNEQYRCEAAQKLAYCYQQGIRFRKNVAMAHKYWKIALEIKDLRKAYAAYQLGIIEKEYKQQPKEAFKYFKTAANWLEKNFPLLAKQDPSSLYLLGSMYLNADGVKKDLEKAKRYLEEAFITAEGEYKSLTINQLLILNIQQGHQENIHFLHECLAEHIKQEREIFCKNLQGEFILPANNAPDVEQAYEQTHPQIMKQRETIEKKLLSTLKSHNIISQKQILSSHHSQSGACQGMIMQFLSSLKPYNAAKGVKAQVIAVASCFTNRIGSAATALQMTHEALHRRCVKNQNAKEYLESVVDRGAEIFQIKISEETKVRIIPWIRSYMVDTAINSTIGITTGSLFEFGIPYIHATTQHLATFMQASPGYFAFIIETLMGSHALSLVKDKQTVYLWDPSTGLMDCGKDPVSFISTFISNLYGHEDHDAVIIYRATAMGHTLW